MRWIIGSVVYLLELNLMIQLFEYIMDFVFTTRSIMWKENTTFREFILNRNLLLLATSAQHEIINGPSQRTARQQNVILLLHSQTKVHRNLPQTLHILARCYCLFQRKNLQHNKQKGELFLALYDRVILRVSVKISKLISE